MTEQTQVSASEQKKEDWMNSKWRPMMGWMYMLVCTMDMVIFPILWSLLQTVTHTPITQWNPLTLQGAGLFHIAMGAVLGIAAFGRTQEKLGGANNGGAQVPSSNFTAPSIPAPAAAPSIGTASSSTGVGSSSVGSISPAAYKPVAAPTMTSSTGKPMPAPAPEPEL